MNTPESIEEKYQFLDVFIERITSLKQVCIDIDIDEINNIRSIESYKLRQSIIEDIQKIFLNME